MNTALYAKPNNPFSYTLSLHPHLIIIARAPAFLIKVFQYQEVNLVITHDVLASNRTLVAHNVLRIPFLDGNLLTLRSLTRRGTTSAGHVHPMSSAMSHNTGHESIASRVLVRGAASTQSESFRGAGTLGTRCPCRPNTYVWFLVRHGIRDEGAGSSGPRVISRPTGKPC